MKPGQNLGKLLTFRNERIRELQETLAAALLQRDDLKIEADKLRAKLAEADATMNGLSLQLTTAEARVKELEAVIESFDRKCMDERPAREGDPSL